MNTLHNAIDDASVRFQVPPPPMAPLLNADPDRPRVERLPFTVRAVGTPADLAKAIQLRYMAYMRHMPAFAQALRQPEADDLVPDHVVLIAASRVDDSPIGTVRIQTNRHAPLNMEQSLELPAMFHGQAIAEVRRLAVAPGGAGRLVKAALLKAVYLYCVRQQMDWILVAARSPLDRMYEQLMLRDVLDGRTFIPLPREHNVAHRVLGAPVADLPTRFVAANHPLTDFFLLTRHPDIDTSWMESAGPRPISRRPQLHRQASVRPL